MSAPLAISATGVGKQFLLGQTRGGYRTLREEAAGLLRGRRSRAGREEFWALRDVSFDVPQGEVLGIIGRNGAGKSTLLKVLARITPPSEGEIRVWGRIGSLLEVGTGFHPELSGRENIFLSGSILGMSRAEITARFDEIVAFAEVERFLDTPVKRYSSGMYVRLAFAVAAHLEPEILIVDEVLAVGDAAFQRKCLGRMQDIAGAGRTVLFVSHNMAAVRQLCPRALLLESGQLVASGPTDQVIDRYLSSFASMRGSRAAERPEGADAWIETVHLATGDGEPRDTLRMLEPARVTIDLQIEDDVDALNLSVQIRDADDLALQHHPSTDGGVRLPTLAGRHRITIDLDDIRLYPGTYSLTTALTRPTQGGGFDVLHVVDGLTFDVEQDFEVIARPLSRQAARFHTEARWSVERREESRS